MKTYASFKNELEIEVVGKIKFSVDTSAFKDIEKYGSIYETGVEFNGNNGSSGIDIKDNVLTMNVQRMIHDGFATIIVEAEIENGKTLLQMLHESVKQQ